MGEVISLAEAERGGTERMMVDALKVEVAEMIDVEMERQDVTRAELARRLKSSRANVTQLLGGVENMTLETLARIGVALNCEVCISFRDVRQSDDRL